MGLNELSMQAFRQEDHLMMYYPTVAVLATYALLAACKKGTQLPLYLESSKGLVVYKAPVTMVL